MKGWVEKFLGEMQKQDLQEDPTSSASARRSERTVERIDGSKQRRSRSSVGDPDLLRRDGRGGVVTPQHPLQHCNAVTAVRSGIHPDPYSRRLDKFQRISPQTASLRNRVTAASRSLRFVEAASA